MNALRRTVYFTGIVALCAWVLVPIYFIALGAFGGRIGVFRWPKSILPTDTSLAAMQLFLLAYIAPGRMVNSIIAAVNSETSTVQVRYFTGVCMDLSCVMDDVVNERRKKAATSRPKNTCADLICK